MSVRNKIIIFSVIFLVLIFGVLPDWFGITSPMQLIIESIFNASQLPILGPIIFILGQVLFWIYKIFAFICFAIGMVILAGLVLFLPSSLALILLLKTSELSDRYTDLPKFSGRKPINKKVFYVYFVLFSAFLTSSILGLVPLIFLKVVGIIYGFWAVHIFVRWLSLQLKK